MKVDLGRTNHELVYRPLGGWPFAGGKVRVLSLLRSRFRGMCLFKELFVRICASPPLRLSEVISNYGSFAMRGSDATARRGLVSARLTRLITYIR